MTRPSLLWTLSIVALAWNVCIPISVQAQRRTSALLPANFNQRTDAMGFRWDITQQGTVNDGSNDCFDGGLQLRMNNQNFNATQPRMTSDGEFVLDGQLGNVKVQRRVKVNTAISFVRYVESFTNTTGATQNVSFEIYNNMGGYPQAMTSNQGRAVGAQFAKDENACIALENPQSSRPSVV